MARSSPIPTSSLQPAVRRPRMGATRKRPPLRRGMRRFTSSKSSDGEAIAPRRRRGGVATTDMSFWRSPPKGEHALLASKFRMSGCNTSFCSMYAIDEAYPPQSRRRMPGSRQARRNLQQARLSPPGVSPRTDGSRTRRRADPLRLQEPQKRDGVCLYLGRPPRQRLYGGLAIADYEALLDELWSYVKRPDIAGEHVMRVGRPVLWDTRCNHARRDAFDPGQRASCTAPSQGRSSAGGVRGFVGTLRNTSSSPGLTRRAR